MSFSSDNDEYIRSNSVRSVDVLSYHHDFDYRHDDDDCERIPPPQLALVRHRSDIIRSPTKVFDLDRSMRSADTQKTSQRDLESSLIEFSEGLEVPTITINAETHIVEVTSYTQTGILDEGSIEPVSVPAEVSLETTAFEVLDEISPDLPPVKSADELVKRFSQDDITEDKIMIVVLPFKTSHDDLLQDDRDDRESSEATESKIVTETPTLTQQEEVVKTPIAFDSNVDNDHQSQVTAKTLLPNSTGTPSVEIPQRLSRVDAILALGDRPPLPRRPESVPTEELKPMFAGDEKKHLDDTSYRSFSLRALKRDENVDEVKLKDPKPYQVASDTPMLEKTGHSELEPKVSNREAFENTDVNMDNSSSTIITSTSNERRKKRQNKCTPTKSLIGSIGRRSFDSALKESDRCRDGVVIPVVEKHIENAALTMGETNQADREHDDDHVTSIKDNEQELSLHQGIRPGCMQDELDPSANSIVTDQNLKQQSETKASESNETMQDQSELHKPQKDRKTLEPEDGSSQNQPKTLQTESEDENKARGKAREEAVGASTAEGKLRETSERSATKREVQESKSQTVVIVPSRSVTETVDNENEEQLDVKILKKYDVASDASTRNTSDDDDDKRNYWKGRRSSFTDVIAKMYAEKNGQVLLPESVHGSETSGDRVSRLLKQLDPDEPKVRGKKIKKPLKRVSDVDANARVDRKVKSSTRRMKKNAKYDDIERLNKTPSIDYEHGCVYYFVPTCIREIFASEVCCGSVCGCPPKTNVASEKKALKSDGWCTTDTSTGTEFISCNDSGNISTSYSTHDDSVADRGGSSDDTKRDEEGDDIKNRDSLTIGSVTIDSCRKGIYTSESATVSIADSQEETDLMHEIKDSLCDAVMCKF
jgi:hypothetical protein